MLRHALRRTMSSRSKLDADERRALSHMLAKRGWKDSLPERDALSKRFEFGDCSSRRPNERVLHESRRATAPGETSSTRVEEA